MFNAKEIWIAAKSGDDDKNVHLCLFYNEHPVKHMEFDSDSDWEEHEKSRDDFDEDCGCR